MSTSKSPMTLLEATDALTALNCRPDILRQALMRAVLPEASLTEERLGAAIMDLCMSATEDKVLVLSSLILALAGIMALLVKPSHEPELLRIAYQQLADYYQAALSVEPSNATA